jgi:hypothetical protein
MSSMTKSLGRPTPVLVILGVLLVLGMTSQAFASPACTAVGGVQVPGECQITTTITLPCPFTLTLPVGESVRITSTGSITCNDPPHPSGNSALDITIYVPGKNLVMEAGSAIRAEDQTGGGSGGNITITVSGSYVVCETLQALWSQTAPVAGPGVVNCNSGGLG